MISIKTEGNIIYTLAQQKLTTEDYEKLIPELERSVAEFNKIRWYFEMEDFKGWELNAFWEDIKFDVKHANDFEKIAVVGEKKWQEWMTDAMKPFTSPTIKFFDFENRKKAKQWIAG